MRSAPGSATVLKCSLFSLSLSIDSLFSHCYLLSAFQLQYAQLHLSSFPSTFYRPVVQTYLVFYCIFLVFVHSGVHKF